MQLHLPLAVFAYADFLRPAADLLSGRFEVQAQEQVAIADHGGVSKTFDPQVVTVVATHVIKKLPQCPDPTGSADHPEVQTQRHHSRFDLPLLVQAVEGVDGVLQAAEGVVFCAFSDFLIADVIYVPGVGLVVTNSPLQIVLAQFVAQFSQFGFFYYQ